MKNTPSKMILLAALAGSLATPALADVQIVFTGSTAFRAVDEDRALSLFDAGVTTSGTGAQTKANQITYQGTISNIFHDATVVTIYMSFSGSATGMSSVAAYPNVTLPCVPPGSSSASLNLAPDVAFSDVFPGGAFPPLSESSFAFDHQIGVIPFVFAADASPNMAGVTNITRDQALLLATASGTIPASFLGGTASDPGLTNVVYFTGRDTGSGTRLTITRDMGLSPNLALQYYNAGGSIGITNFVPATNGFSSGSFVASTLQTNINFIGYLGLSDFNSISNGAAVALAYDNVPFTTNNVANGTYALWGYEHMLPRHSALSAQQEQVRAALESAITNSTYQDGNVLYNSQFVTQAHMQVQRLSDGGTISGLNF